MLIVHTHPAAHKQLTVGYVYIMIHLQTKRSAGKIPVWNVPAPDVTACIVKLSSSDLLIKFQLDLASLSYLPCTDA